MYSSCIFCSGDLGGNDALEAFPVSRRIAFDLRQGHLWAICSKCGRWNLSPIEERWEAVEEAEVRFRANTQRVHAENIGIGKLPDGTLLVRVGEALPGEIAVWRYGDRLQRRRIGYALGKLVEPLHVFLVVIPAGIVVLPAVTAALPPIAALPAAVGVATLAWLPKFLGWRRIAGHVLLRIDGPHTAEGSPLIIRLADAIGARLSFGERGELAVCLETRPLDEIRRRMRLLTGLDMIREPVTVTGDGARRLLGRLMVRVNRVGASRTQIDASLSKIALAGGAQRFLDRIAAAGFGVGGARSHRPETAAPLLPVTEAFALEMALHEETERRAFTGELRALELAWKEAQEIAKIADSL